MAHYNLACAYSLKDEKNLSIESLQKAISLDRRAIEGAKTNSCFDNIRESPEFQYNLGLAYFNQGKYDLAVESYQKAIIINPNVAQPHNNLGLAYFNQGKLDRAIAEFNKAIIINPNDAEAHNNLGIAYDKQGNDEQAIIHYKEFIRLARTSPTLRSSIPEIEHRIEIIEMTSKLFDE